MPDNNEFVGRREFETFKNLLADQKSRWDKRLDNLETETKENRTLTTSVAELAQSVKTMAEEQKRQGQRLDKIESRDGEAWRKAVAYIATTVAGLILGFLFTYLTKGGV